jgi:hypothetical protein
LLFLFVLLFLPGRLFEAYTYLPLACAAVAIVAAASHVEPVWLWIALILWMPWNARDLRQERNATLALDDEAAAFVDQLDDWAAKHPAIDTFVYSGLPRGYHHWGVTAAWTIAHNNKGSALYVTWPETAKVMAEETVALGAWKWDGKAGALTIQIHLPGH